MQVKIYHNPRCSKSRQTLALLRERGLEPQVIEYLQTPPSVKELDAILVMLGKSPREVMRRHEAPYAEQNLDDPAKSRADLLAAMVAHPVLIERPIVVANGKAAIGRPPQDALAIV